MDKTLQQETDKLLLAVGYGLRSWAGVEDAVLQLFIEAAKTNPPGLAITIMNAIVSFDARMKVCHEVMRVRLRGDPELPVWDKLVARTLKFYKKRHELAHFNLVTEITGATETHPQINKVKFHPYGFFQSFTGQPDRTLSLLEITQRTMKFEEIKEGIGYFWSKLINQKAHTEEFPLRVPDLIHQLRKLVDQTNEEPQPPPRS